MNAAVSVALDNEGFLQDRDDWSEEVAVELAKSDDFEMTEQVMHFIKEARAMYEEDGVVPPIRIFAKKQKVSTKELYDIFKKGPMKLICKWGGLPKPTGCV
ncbi:TusE/DsrC/DsvC family sulfur relay protein [Thiocystis violacea]|uniref:TusE/DsrC/DsvC family sulfur relay protein n=1 Tax=Thiocystis violacea TaxID=13725 RepID=UPI0019051462|nr:TusE/DsrC/DsvC family sulfur relay protein [Thiocystis violacea]MBK1720710.1 TusE/DsrC/DsvC family sulfurtransferase [Thiocystis violacea]